MRTLYSYAPTDDRWVSNAYLYRRASDGKPFGLVPPPTVDMRRLRHRAKEVKESKGLSIQDLVTASGLSRTAVLDMLNGRGRINDGRVDTWWALTWALGVPFGELMASLDDD